MSMIHRTQTISSDSRRPGDYTVNRQGKVYSGREHIGDYYSPAELRGDSPSSFRPNPRRHTTDDSTTDDSSSSEGPCPTWKLPPQYKQALENYYGPKNMSQVFGILRAIDELCENKTLSSREQIRGIQAKLIQLDSLKINNEELIYPGTDPKEEREFYARQYGNLDPFVYSPCVIDIINHGKDHDRVRALGLLNQVNLFNGGRMYRETDQHELDSEQAPIFLPKKDHDWLMNYINDIYQLKKSTLRTNKNSA